ncbi:oligoendopeptidase F [Xylocopilactobacillus apis]|uniref:Oligopeptidase F n=1 Tax=Xylocopilactobacillus apis TaxID=2932183 RepID=A0AAU9DJT2_9LACO|nr:oligoendopeptidase F [Xylocopilactobacillus apis]BDR55684.1 oligoendopeptidase F [Xylocopilactobacillus apis]
MQKMNKVPTRAEVDSKYTWDLTPLCKNNEDFKEKFNNFKEKVLNFCDKYSKTELDLSQLEEVLVEYNKLLKEYDPIAQYGWLVSTTDLTNAQNNQLSYEIGNFDADFSAQMRFIEDALLALSTDELTELQEKLPQFKGYLRRIKHYKRIALDPKVEHALAKLKPTFNSFSNIYGQIRSADLEYDTFEANGETYPLSFGLYEDRYSYDPDPEIRRNSFSKFSKELAHHQNAAAAAYLEHVSNEKRLADLYGASSVVDYLLHNQEVMRPMFDRQIDLIINKFGPVMQKYMNFLKNERGLDQMTFADRLIDLDPDFAPEVTVEDSMKYVQSALSVLGDEYVEMIMKAYPERWVDFVQNKGKETGGFCSQPYNNHPYVLMSWQNVMADVYTLIHEMGHCGQGILSTKNNTLLDSEPSLYIIEAPSTFNELLLTDSLTHGTDDPRMKRFAYTKLLSNTYFHNFITHLLEAAYQREVYNLIDEGKSFNADKLNEITLNVYHQFFGESIEFNPGTELTWMRQSHYYMGLYSYVYSASLTVSTQAFLNIKNEGQPAIDRWLELLRLGGSADPIDSAKIAGVDITTDEPLINTINYLDSVVDQVISLTKEI